MFENFVVMSICNNVYNVKGSNLDLRGADDGSKLLQCYDPAVCTTNYALHNFIWLWNNKTCNIFNRNKICLFSNITKYQDQKKGVFSFFIVLVLSFDTSYIDNVKPKPDVIKADVLTHF
jgi:hypothetical protein